jgi:hypothetical protein
MALILNYKSLTSKLGRFIDLFDQLSSFDINIHENESVNDAKLQSLIRQ